MMFYLLNILLFLFECFCINIINLNLTQKRSLLLFVFFFHLFLVHAFKDPYSFLDTPFYADAYNVMCDYGMEGYGRYAFLKTEIGYVYLMWVASWISSNTQFIFVVTSLIILGGYFFAIKRYSSIIWLSVFILLITNYNQSLFVIRQYVAIGILMYSLPYVVRRDKWRFFLLVVLAASIHYTAIIFSLLYVVYGLDVWKSKRDLALLLLGSVLLFVAFRYLYSVVINIDSLGYSSYKDGEGTNAKGFLLQLGVLLLFWWSCKNSLHHDDVDRLIFYILFLGCLFSFVGIGLVATSRMNMYYSSIGLILALPRVLKRKNPITRIGALGVLIVLIYFYVANLSEMEDYKFISL